MLKSRRGKVHRVCTTFISMVS
ncbi:hypothetical protein Goshw_022210 [Gossypium schwendimanii]|uniref:Uncharacterized protein n=1 Tax=Gossypium schwendimanii TaxID=34291 RepID=A0A7J9LBH4_GOSSC|nr:hypothetical protein [Gossypium schwendimanii]